MPIDVYWLIAVLLLGLVWLIGRWHRRHRMRPGSTAITATVQRRLRPRMPDDCPACCQQEALPNTSRPSCLAVRPWCELKSRRGAPKRITTHGVACPNRTCVYSRITDAHVHALVGDGTHGRRERIQTFRCQACGITFSARRDTPLYRLKTPAYRVGEVLTAGRRGGYRRRGADLWASARHDHHLADPRWRS